MDHDLRPPTLVLAGAWNPAIFSVQWIATHLFGKKEGELLNVANVISGSEQSLFIDQIGVGAGPDRLNLYCNTWVEAQKLEIVAKEVLKLLSHTPVVGVGVNFSFVERQPDPCLIDRFQTHESLNQFRKIVGQRLITMLEIAPKTTLNLDRQCNEEMATFNFNYHHAVRNAGEAENLLSGSVAKCYADALELLAKVYGLNPTDYIAHNLMQKAKIQGE